MAGRLRCVRHASEALPVVVGAITVREVRVRAATVSIVVTVQKLSADIGAHRAIVILEMKAPGLHREETFRPETSHHLKSIRKTSVTNGERRSTTATNGSATTTTTGISRYVAVAARGTEAIVERELVDAGVQQVAPTAGAVIFDCDRVTAYRFCAQSRVATRLLAQIATFEAADGDSLYDGVRSIDWSEHLSVDQTLAVQCVAPRGVSHNTKFLAQRTKDAIVDQFRARGGKRPDVDRAHPDVPVHVYFAGERANVSVELTDRPLHQRGYRPPGAAAPLRETLAAAILQIADWPAIFGDGGGFVDPMCGSGTLVIEAAWMAAGVSPRCLWGHRVLSGWLQHDPKTWSEVKPLISQPKIDVPVFGFDASEHAVSQAAEALGRAGLDRTRVQRRAVNALSAPDCAAGLLVVNPPYGERLGQEGELVTLYRALGDTFKREFAGWQTYVFTGSELLAKRIGLRAESKTTLFNGPIRCQLLSYPIGEGASSSQGPGWRKPSPQAQMLVNRLAKNRRRLKSKLPIRRFPCYRLYDRDIPEYNVAIDVYEDQACVQEYARPTKVDADSALTRIEDVISVVQQFLQCGEDDIYVKVRNRQQQGSQYERRPGADSFKNVTEGDLRFRVELAHRLDTGLFLDHRLVRERIASAASGARFLNLFAYTCSASVYAAAGGAVSTTSVDLSKPYLNWGRQNFALNGFSLEDHRFISTDASAWLAKCRQSFDLVFINPPTFSRAKRRGGDFEIARDHGNLLSDAVRCLSDQGRIIFSTHAHGFELNAPSRVKVAEITDQITPIDFRRDPFRCWEITRR